MNRFTAGHKKYRACHPERSPAPFLAAAFWRARRAARDLLSAHCALLQKPHFSLSLDLPLRTKTSFPLSYTSTTEPLSLPMLERLQKIIARAGIASRRHAEGLIKSGLVTVNGQTITELGSKADESKDHIKVQGKLLRPETERVYLVLNKPPEVVSTMIDPEGRRSLADMLHGVSQRVFPVGRLEYHSLGLVFLTNDGELANLMLKAHHLPQT